MKWQAQGGKQGIAQTVSSNFKNQNDDSFINNYIRNSDMSVGSVKIIDTSSLYTFPFLSLVVKNSKIN